MIPKLIWVMQGWLFVDKKDFWQPDQIKAYLNAVPDNKLIVLDLWAEENPVWNRTDAFYGKALDLVDAAQFRRKELAVWQPGLPRKGTC